VLVAVGVRVSLVYIGLALLPIHYERFLLSLILLLMKRHASKLYIRLEWHRLLMGMVLARGNSLFESILLFYFWRLTLLDTLYHYQLSI